MYILAVYITDSAKLFQHAVFNECFDFFVSYSQFEFSGLRQVYFINKLKMTIVQFTARSLVRSI